MCEKFYFTLLSLVLTLSFYVNAQIRSSNFENLSPNYTMGYSVDFEAKSVEFELTVATRGFVGFGLSPTGGMTGADIIITGVFNNGTPYFSDRHATAQQEPVVDKEENWTLISASENGTHTRITVSRPWDTCDFEDMKISNNTARVIWAIGETDNITYHGNGILNRGTKSIGLLDPILDPDTSEFKSWKMTINKAMPGARTTYWCTIHKSPHFPTKRHFVGFEAFLKTEEALKHSHHIIVYSCAPPSGSTPEEYFDEFVAHEGEECYGVFNEQNPEQLPKNYCRRMVFGWAVGGKPMYLPDHVGYPLQGTEYYMLEVHMDNPKEESGLQFETGLVMYYIDTPRLNDAGTMTMGHDTIYTLTIPPMSPDFTVVGQCSAECTKHIPSSGIKIFNAFQHAHLSGRKMKTRIIRGGKELPWLMNDDHYDFDYQQNRPLLEEVEVFPGDHFATECTYDTTWKPDRGVTIGGESTHEEMCNTVIWYYPKINLTGCLSRVAEPTIQNIFEIIPPLNWSLGGTDPIIMNPPSMAGLKYSQALDQVVNWTDDLRTRVQYDQRYLPQNSLCLVNGQMDPTVPQTTYPEGFTEYIPPDTCSRSTTTTSTSPPPPENGGTIAIAQVSWKINCVVFGFWVLMNVIY